LRVVKHGGESCPKAGHVLGIRSDEDVEGFGGPRDAMKVEGDAADHLVANARARERSQDREYLAGVNEPPEEVR
jgi:hypothetical protein